MATIMDTLQEFGRLYNEARNSGDNVSAVRLGRNIVEIAESQLKNPDLPAAHRDYYQRWSSLIREFLANTEMGRVSRPGKHNSDPDESADNTDWFSADVPKLSMADVAGLTEVKEEFMVNVFAPIDPKYSQIYRKYRNDLGIQILLYGPPGTGKTHIVKCLAGQLGCKIAVVQIKDVMARLVGDGAKIIAAVFEQAKKYDKCIIFFDEIDAIAASRDDDESRHTKEQLTTLLTYMDGFMSKTAPGQIRIVVAATNRPWVLDSAVKRGGRFETQIYIPLPDLAARRKLVEIALGKDPKVKNRLDIPCEPDVTPEWLAMQLEGYAGADIKAICKQIINRPLRRAIFAEHNSRPCPDYKITRKDCAEVIGKYINSITDEMLLQFDAYKANMEFKEYIKAILRADHSQLKDYARRWLTINGLIKQ